MKLGPKAAAAAMIVSAALALTGCGGSSAGSTNSASATSALTLGGLQDLVSFDPVDAHIGHTMPYYQAVYDTLLVRDPDGTISPMLATEQSWNADYTVLTLKLRTDAKFTDGTAVDAAAVKANLDNFKKAKGRDAYMVASLKSVAVVDPSTVAITLGAPDPAFEYYLTQAAGFMASPKALGTPGIKTDPVGSGPYILDKTNTVKGSQYVYTKNPDYWNSEIQKFDKITIKFLADITARTNALVSGQIDAALLDPKTGKQAEGAGLVLNKSEVDWHGILLYDRGGKINPELADVKVRQAINYSFDRQTILDQQFLGQGTPTSQVFGPESGAYIKELDSKYTYDPAKAKQLLTEAGYPNGFTLKIPTMAGFDAVNAVYAQQLADVGIKLQLESVPQANYVADMAAGKYAAATFNLYQGEPWVAINQMISTSALYNPFKTSDPEIAALVEEVQVGGGNSSELAKKVNTYVTENAWFAPLFRIDQMYYTNKKVTAEPQLQQAIPSIYNYAPAK